MVDVPPTKSTFSRRALLQLSGASVGAIALGIDAPEAADATPARPVPDGAFSLGVASGDPRPDQVVLWTRLAPEPLADNGHGGMPLRPARIPVHYEVADDQKFRSVVRRGSVIASPELAHAVHPEVRGLKPGREYFYRFRVGRQISPVGRTKTMPDTGADIKTLSFATASCQRWYEAHFTAYRHMAEEDLDLILFLGDYIYEYGITDDNLLRQGASVPSSQALDIETLEQYRLRHSLFKSDSHLQDAHAIAPWLTIWDDHDVATNYGNEIGPVGPRDVPSKYFIHRRAVGYRAFYENVPLSLGMQSDGPDARIYQHHDAGSLARLYMLDTRQYRDAPPEDREEQYAKGRTILGTDQERWLHKSLHRSKAHWNLVVSGVAMVPVTESRTDQWDGYPAARERILETMQRSDNPVVLSGDIHHSVAADVKAKPDDASSSNVGVELVCTSIGSNGDGAPKDSLADDWLQHSYVKLYDGRRGYVHCRLTDQELTADFKYVPYVEADDQAPLKTIARFRTEAGNPGLERID